MSIWCKIFKVSLFILGHYPLQNQNSTYDLIPNKLLTFYYFTKKNNKCPTRLFYKHCFFSSQSQCYLTFSWIRLLLKRCSLHITNITLGHILYLVYLCTCLGLSIMSDLCDLFFIFTLIFINPLLLNVVKWSDTFLKSCSICCKIFKMCLTILQHCEVKG